RSASCPERRCGGENQRLLESLEEYREAGPGLWTTGEILLRYCENQLGIRHCNHAGRQNYSLYHQYLQTGSPERKSSDGRDCKLSGFFLALKLDHQSPGTV